MLILEMPSYTHKISKINQQLFIFDFIRKKNILLTPEEWVRQNFICFLAENYAYPKHLMRVETGLHYAARQKRTDIAVLDRSGNNFLLIECKAAHIPISIHTLYQVATYAYVLKPKYILATNGHECLVAELAQTQKDLIILEKIPIYGSE